MALIGMFLEIQYPPDHCCGHPCVCTHSQRPPTAPPSPKVDAQIKEVEQKLAVEAAAAAAMKQEQAALQKQKTVERAKWVQRLF